MNRKTIIAAGLLCLGTSPAFAITIPAMAPDMAKAVKAVWTDQMAAEQAAGVTVETTISQTKTPKMRSAGADFQGETLATKSADIAVESAALGDPNLDLSVKPDDLLAKSGPSEAVMATSSTPAAVAYPACRPGAGDDNCIQLYEPGVRAQLAGWNRSAAGSESAMGGPYEPVDTTLAGELGDGESIALSMNGDGITDTAIGETSDSADLG